MRGAIAGLLLFASLIPARGDVKVEKVAYFNQPNCFKLSNGKVEVIVTTDIGPRVIAYRFAGEDNILAEIPDTVVKTALGDWKPYGGHRLWTAPEAMPRSYSPDNATIEYKLVGANTIELDPPSEPNTGIKKDMILTLDDSGTGETILHRLTNQNDWATHVAPWALTIMNGGGNT